LHAVASSATANDEATSFIRLPVIVVILAGYGVIRKLSPHERVFGSAANSTPWKFPIV
jgi:hypothetical protein